MIQSMFRICLCAVDDDLASWLRDELSLVPLDRAVEIVSVDDVGAIDESCALVVVGTDHLSVEQTRRIAAMPRIAPTIAIGARPEQIGEARWLPADTTSGELRRAVQTALAVRQT
jgi:hypothetical protein